MPPRHEVLFWPLPVRWHPIYLPAVCKGNTYISPLRFAFKRWF